MPRKQSAQRYLKDRRSGRTYGWNHEMAKLPYMVETDSPVPGEPDPAWVDDESGFPVAQVSAEDQADLDRAAEQAAKELDTDDNISDVVINPTPTLVDGEPPWAVDTEGNRLYDENDAPLVYVLDDSGNLVIGDDNVPLVEVYQEPKKRGKK